VRQVIEIVKGLPIATGVILSETDDVTVRMNTNRTFVWNKTRVVALAIASARSSRKWKVPPITWRLRLRVGARNERIIDLLQELDTVQYLLSLCSHTLVTITFASYFVTVYL
jgi:hypothetical protein